MASPSNHVRYPNLYVWLVFVSALDIMLTWVVLHLGGSEANPLAAGVLERWGLPGMVAFKMALVSLAIVIGEAVGKRNEPLGRRFVCYAIAISAFPVVLALLLIRRHGG